MRRADHRIVPVFGTSSIRRPTYPSDETDNANNAVKYRCSTRYRSTTGQVRSNALHRTEPRLLDAFLMNRLAAGFSSQSHGEDVHELLAKFRFGLRIDIRPLGRKDGAELNGDAA